MKNMPGCGEVSSIMKVRNSHDVEIKDFIRQNQHLFWWVPKEQQDHISEESLVEHVLNYGDETSVKRLFELLGVESVSEVFYRQISGNRCNYFPQVINFFTLYFQRHAPRNSLNRTT